MQEKDTNELEQELGRTHLNDYVQYALKNKESMISDATSFSSYMKGIMRQRGISQQTAFLKAYLNDMVTNCYQVRSIPASGTSSFESAMQQD